MSFKYWKTGLLLISILLLVFTTPYSLADSFDQTLSYQIQFGLANPKLHVSVPPSLYDYYSGKTHTIRYDREYARFVTPDAFQPIAENLRNLTRNKPHNDEAFANAVLQLVHQIPYVEGDLKYPVETIVENAGKCDTLSLLAASIMKAGGLDVALLYFKEVHHMNIGVYLPYEPQGSQWWQAPTGYEFNGKKYWIAESTSAAEWKVGDVPPMLIDTNPAIISMENTEEQSPAHVSSKWNSPLNSSSISINLSSETLENISQQPTLTITGSISPAIPNENVAVYFSQDQSTYNVFKTKTGYLGNYSFSWNLTSPGTYYVKTSWGGNSDYAGADSETLTVFIGFPKSLIQFKGPSYYYDYGHPAFANHELRIRQGVKNFLDLNLTGKGVLLTGDFIIVQSGQSITISKDNTTQLSLEEIGIKKGEEALRLPDDIEQTTNNKFGFILRNSGGSNYSVTVKGMNDYDVGQINKQGEKGPTFMNAAAGIRENTWYKITAKISENEVIAEVHDTNGNLLESVTAKDDATRTNELVMLIANNTDKAVAFKNLRVETLNEPAQPPPEDNEKTADGPELLVPYVAFAILLSTLVAVIYKKRKSFLRQKEMKIT